MDDAYIPIELAERENLRWSMRRETREIVIELAQEFPNYNFVIKTHPQQRDLRQLQRLYDSGNLRVIGGAAVANELIQRSELIIAFQTTAVIEAMLLRRRVVYTYWDGLIPRLEKDLLPFHLAAGIVTVRSRDECARICEQVLRGNGSAFAFSPDDMRRRDQFVGEYLHQPDGQVSRRFWQMVERFIS
jgi:hypothetical protein